MATRQSLIGLRFFTWGRKRMEAVNLNSSQLKADQEPDKLVVITGCDSGLGLAMSCWAAKANYRVLAVCYNDQSFGAQFLSNFKVNDQKLIQTVKVDLTKSEDIQKLVEACQTKLISSTAHHSLQLWAVIPNAAIGSFGEFLWMTEQQGRKMMEVNFWGSVLLVKAFHLLLLQHKSKVIVVTSDCANYPLAGLSVYSATKAALQTWAIALRLELQKYGIFVTSFQPGNFPTQSSLFQYQREAYEEMKANMSEEAVNFYGEYFHGFNNHLLNFFKCSSRSDTVSKTDKEKFKDLKDNRNLEKCFLKLLNHDTRLVPILIRESPIITMIHFLVDYLPIRLGDWIKASLMKFPLWKSKSLN